MPKFFVKQDQIEENVITLRGDDAFHISRSLRMAKGEHITVCDMQANEYDCVLLDFLPDAVVAEIFSTRKADTESPVRIYLYQALPKGDKLDTVIQKSVECGVHEIALFESERCVVKSKKDAEERKNERRNRIALEAAKQSGRGYIPLVKGTFSFEEAIKEAVRADLCLFCYEGETEATLKTVLTSTKAEGKKAESISSIIGSEGGFSVNEALFARENGAVSVSLGKRILRTETAAPFVLSCLSYVFEM